MFCGIIRTVVIQNLMSGEMYTVECVLISHGPGGPVWHHLWASFHFSAAPFVQFLLFYIYFELFSIHFQSSLFELMFYYLCFIVTLPFVTFIALFWLFSLFSVCFIFTFLCFGLIFGILFF